MNGVNMNNQSDGFSGAELGLGGGQGPEAEDYTQEERDLMAEVERAQEESRRKLYEKQMEEQAQKE